MPSIQSINHVALIVDDIGEARRFYGEELGLELLPSFDFDYPAVFFRVNETQQLHITEWEDKTSFRGHFCMVVEDFVGLFRKLVGQGLIDVRPWGNVRRLPDGGMQMFARDPAGNLLEFASRPEEAIDPALFEHDLVDEGQGLYASGREDGRGLGSAEATLHHGGKGS